jgi:EmrB/QacA subfamily drug resistance transporter
MMCALLPLAPPIRFIVTSIALPQNPAAAERTAPAAPPRGALASLALAVLLSSLGTSIANVGLPTLAEAFAASFQQVQWVALAYLLSLTAMVVGAGRLGDGVGRRRLLLTGIFLFVATSLLCGIAPALGWLIAARVGQGLGAAMMMALALALVGETVPKAATGRAMGLLGTMSAVGTALGPSMGGVLIASFGWRAIFLVNLPLGVAAFLLARRYLPVDRRRAHPHWSEFDPAGTLLLVFTLVAYALAVTLGRGHFGLLNLGWLAGATAGAGLLGLVEARVAAPLVPLTMFRDLRLSAGLAMSALVTTVMMATLVVGPFYLSRALGCDVAVTGLALSAGPLVAAIAGVPAGRWVDRVGSRRATVVGLAAVAVGAALLGMMPLELGVAGYVAPLVLMTAGYGLFQAANNTAVMSGAKPDQRGVCSGLLNLSRNMGLVTGVSAMGAVFAFAAGAGDLAAAQPEAVARGMRVTFAVATLLVGSALVVARTGHRAGPESFQ